MGSQVTAMTSAHVESVQLIDECCGDSHYPLKSLRAAIRDKPTRAFVLADDDDVMGFVVVAYRSGSRSMHIERIGAKTGHEGVYDRLLKSIYFMMEVIENCDRLTAVVRISNLLLRAKLSQHGFFVSTTSGENPGRTMGMTKVMIESTWQEGTHYPFGMNVLEEICAGEARVLAVDTNLYISDGAET